MSALRSLLFALFQFVVTPIYAVLVLLSFWAPPLPRFKFIIGWCWLNRGRGALDLRHPPSGHRRGEYSAARQAAHRHVQAFLDLGDAGAQFFLPAARVCRQEGVVVHSVLWLGVHARIAHHDRPQGRRGRDAANRRAGTASGWRRDSGSFSTRKGPGSGPVRARTTRPAAPGLRSLLGVPIVPVAHNAGYLWPKGVLGKRPGTVTVSIGPPIGIEGKDMQRLTNEVESWIENEVARLGNPLRETPTAHD